MVFLPRATLPPTDRTLRGREDRRPYLHYDGARPRVRVGSEKVARFWPTSLCPWGVIRRLSRSGRAKGLGEVRDFPNRINTTIGHRATCFTFFYLECLSREPPSRATNVGVCVGPRFFGKALSTL